MNKSLTSAAVSPKKGAAGRAARWAHSLVSPQKQAWRFVCYVWLWTTRWNGSAFYANSAWSILALIWTHTEAWSWIHNTAVHSEPQEWYTASVCDEAVCNLLLTRQAREDDSFLVSIHFLLQQSSTLECWAFGGDRPLSVNKWCKFPLQACGQMWVMFVYWRPLNSVYLHSFFGTLQDDTIAWISCRLSVILK